MDHCPKTAEIDMLACSHNGLTIHAVAHWLEKIYAVDERVAIKPLTIGQEEKKRDLDDNIPQSDATLAEELETLRAVFELLRAGETVKAQTLLIQSN